MALTRPSAHKRDWAGNMPVGEGHQPVSLPVSGIAWCGAPRTGNLHRSSTVLLQETADEAHVREVFGRTRDSLTSALLTSGEYSEMTGARSVKRPQGAAGSPDGLNTRVVLFVKFQPGEAGP